MILVSVVAKRLDKICGLIQAIPVAVAAERPWTHAFECASGFRADLLWLASHAHWARPEAPYPLPANQNASTGLPALSIDVVDLTSEYLNRPLSESPSLGIMSGICHIKLPILYHTDYGGYKGLPHEIHVWISNISIGEDHPTQ
jgi:hypothetical protein